MEPLGGGFLSGKYSPDHRPADGRMSQEGSFEAARLAQDEQRHWRTLDAVARISAETGRSVPQVALKWLLGRPAVTAPIMGVRTLAQLEDDLGATGWDLEHEHLDLLDEVSPPPRDYVSDFIRGANSRPDRRGQGAED